MAVVRLTAVASLLALLAMPCRADEQSVRDRLADLEFQRSDAIARMTRLRSLSLLTLADTGRSRLFLGVNSDGLLGLHFGAARRNDDRYMELVRMPYLSTGLR